jgi:ligand-binding sensor domain-containing protein
MGRVTQILLVPALLSVRSALALDPERHITELVHRVWDDRSGVPADIRALAQTSDGYLWVGSLRGLYRFDGVQFQKFEPESGARLPSQEVRSLFAASDGRLWVGYRTGGASVLAAGKLTNYNSTDGFPEVQVRGFAQDPQGRIWAASLGGLECFENGRWHAISSGSGFPDSKAFSILIDHLGALWVAGEHHIAVLPPQASKFELVASQSVRCKAHPDGTVWMAERFGALPRCCRSSTRRGSLHH